MYLLEKNATRAAKWQHERGTKTIFVQDIAVMDNGDKNDHKLVKIALLDNSAEIAYTFVIPKSRLMAIVSSKKPELVQ